MPPAMSDERRRLFVAALGFATLSMPSYDRALWGLRTWLDAWTGIGRIAVGMHRQGYDLQLTQYDDRGWRATFYTTGMEHSPTSGARLDDAIAGADLVLPVRRLARNGFEAWAEVIAHDFEGLLPRKKRACTSRAR